MRLKLKHFFQGLFCCYFAFFMVSCAVQQTPTGGEKDIVPPKLISVNPPSETTNFKVEEIEIIFSEYVQLKNPFQEISISPEPEVRPEFRPKKNILLVKFTDTLLENTTYQINFGKSIGDMNEGNPLPNYKYIFSTGNQIDSLKISGSVDTYSLEKSTESRSSGSSPGSSNILVLIHPETDSLVNQDSLIMKKKPGYYTYADSSGNFEITNLKEGTYRLYALKEENNSRIYDENVELLGFLQEPLVVTKDTVVNTLFLARLQQQQLEVLNDRNQDARLTLLLNKKSEDLDIQVLFPPAFKDKIIREEDEATDSVVLWLPSPVYDSVKVAVGENGRYIDTILFRNFNPKEKLDPFEITDELAQGALKPGTDPVLVFSRPVNSPDISKIELQEDSVKVNAATIKLNRLSPRKYAIDYNWKQRSNYQITIGAGYITDIYQAGNKAYQRQFIADSLENYGNIFIRYTVPDSLPDSTQYVAQLLNVDNTIIKENIITKNQRIEYRTLSPAGYKIRIIFDRNKNGRWDGGFLFQKIQPEKILFFDPGETLRANWDQEYTIDIPAPDTP